MFQLTTRRIQGTSVDRVARELAGLGLAILVAAALIVVPFPLNVALVLAPLGGVLLLAFPVLLPLMLIASVPAQAALPVPEPLTLTRAAVAASLAITPLVILGCVRRLRLPWFVPVVIAFAVVLGLSLWNADDPSLGYSGMYQWAVAIFAFWMVIHFVRTRTRALLAFALMAVLAGLQGLYGAMQALLGIGPESFEIGMGLSRAYGTFGMPNSYAAYLEMATLPLIPVFVWALQHANGVMRVYRDQRLHGVISSTRMRRELILSVGLALVLLGGLLAGLAGVAMSFSRGAWLGTAAAAVVIVLLMGRRMIVSSLIGGVAIALLLMVAAPGGVASVLEDRFSQLVDQVQIDEARDIPLTDENFATVERLAHWQTAIAMWDDQPWLGVGTGSFDSRFTEYAVHPDFTESQGHAHNYYLHLLAENGVAGLLAYLILVIAAMIISWRAARIRDPLAQAVGIGAVGITAALLVHNMVENLHVLNISIQIFAIWGLAWVALQWRREEWQPSARNKTPALLYDSLTRSAGRESVYADSEVGTHR